MDFDTIYVGSVVRVRDGTLHKTRDGEEITLSGYYVLDAVFDDMIFLTEVHLPIHGPLNKLIEDGIPDKKFLIISNDNHFFDSVVSIVYRPTTFNLMPVGTIYEIIDYSALNLSARGGEGRTYTQTRPRQHIPVGMFGHLKRNKCEVQLVNYVLYPNDKRNPWRMLTKRGSVARFIEYKWLTFHHFLVTGAVKVIGFNDAVVRKRGIVRRYSVEELEAIIPTLDHVPLWI